ncbi:putative transmembrane protein [Clostridium tetanomorphum]|nr:putative transmembrane protein [Clostridium tetanomorphum]
MRLEELKMVVAENCEGYEPIASVFVSDIGSNITDSCENCENFVKGKCIKNLFDPIKERIYRN